MCTDLREENSLPEPAYLSFSSWSRDQSKLGREPEENNGRPTRVMEKALNDTLTSLAEKRRMAQRPDSVDVSPLCSLIPPLGLFLSHAHRARQCASRGLGPGPFKVKQTIGFFVLLLNI